MFVAFVIPGIFWGCLRIKVIFCYKIDTRKCWLKIKKKHRSKSLSALLMPIQTATRRQLCHRLCGSSHFSVDFSHKPHILWPGSCETSFTSIRVTCKHDLSRWYTRYLILALSGSMSANLRLNNSCPFCKVPFTWTSSSLGNLTVPCTVSTTPLFIQNCSKLFSSLLLSVFPCLCLAGKWSSWVCFIL